MGTGVGDNYKSRLKVGEFNSLGTMSIIPDWKGTRGIQCFSQGEAMWYYILRWDDNNVQIYEQVALANALTTAIAQKLGFKHPLNNSHIMTTDFVAIEADGTIHAYSVKPDRDLDVRAMEILTIEKIYWLSLSQNAKNDEYDIHTKYDVLFKTDVNRILYNNIKRIVPYYKPNKEYDHYDFIKHKIATKEYKCDMEHKILDTEDLDRIWEENK